MSMLKLLLLRSSCNSEEYPLVVIDKILLSSILLKFNNSKNAIKCNSICHTYCIYILSIYFWSMLWLLSLRPCLWSRVAFVLCFTLLFLFHFILIYVFLPYFIFFPPAMLPILSYSPRNFFFSNIVSAVLPGGICSTFSRPGRVAFPASLQCLNAECLDFVRHLVL
jgi:hypothetical protein